MPIDTGIFSNNTCLEQRLITSYDELRKFVEHCKAIGLKVVLTSGSFDLIHIGHAEYLQKAKESGDLLVVGVDSDKKIRDRKGPNRPVVPESERLAMLTHLRHVDVIFVKHPEDEKFQLLKTVQPDVLVISKSTKHKASAIKDMKNYCSEVKELEPQSETSTSAKVRLLHVDGAEQLAKLLGPKIVEVIEKSLHDLGGGKK